MSFCVEISRAHDGAELVTHDAHSHWVYIGAANGERNAAPEGIGEARLEAIETPRTGAEKRPPPLVPERKGRQARTSGCARMAGG